jgi:hypothetical protein
MFFKGVVGKLQTFFGAIAPEMAVHGVVHGLPIWRRTGAPRVVPVVMGCAKWWCKLECGGRNGGGENSGGEKGGVRTGSHGGRS